MTNDFNSLSKTQQTLVTSLRNQRSSFGSYEATAESLRQMMRSLGVVPANFETDLTAALSYLDAQVVIDITRGRTIFGSREDWYEGPNEEDLHWPSLRNYLLNEKNWSEDAVRSIHVSSNEIVSVLGDPGRETFSVKGLVVGYVQSGKTANMTGVIAKAVDAGYNLIVVLGGLTNKLRAQTQTRIENDVVLRHRDHWTLYTTSEEQGDFIMPYNQRLISPGREAQLIVMKKETSRLAQLLKTIQKTPSNIRRRFRALIIDDECDQASVNTQTNRIESMSRTNQSIRELLAALPAVSYVGYTATPFANVFINPNVDPNKLDDLYPSDFITSLPKPDGYFGISEVFGAFDSDADDPEADGANIFRNVPADELRQLLPASENSAESFKPQITKSLEDALLWYILSCAERLRRGHDSAHMTMLVHTSSRVVQHSAMAKAIQEWLEQNADDLRIGYGNAWDRAHEVWERETSLVETDIVTLPTSSATLLDEIGEVLDRLELVVENNPSDTRLDYSGEPKIYIVVGGTILSRGLTLEGLSVSFFLRNSTQYDSLLQMGRWFGFRNGYEDLPRLWTSAGLIEKFRSLARIEDEIRAEFEVYAKEGVTPLDVAVKVRKIPGMAITAASKMRSAVRASVSLSGRHIQTIRFDHRDENRSEMNWTATSELFSNIESTGIVLNERGVYEDVPSAVIRRFMKQYRISDAHYDLNHEIVARYIDKLDDTMRWNVSLHQTRDGEMSSRELGPIGPVRMVKRSKLTFVREGRETDSYADIKALMSRADITVDALEPIESIGKKSWPYLKSQRPDKPLLVIYAIDKDSRPSGTPAVSQAGYVREELGAVEDQIGIGIVFPGAEDRSGTTYAVDLQRDADSSLDEVVDDELL